MNDLSKMSNSNVLVNILNFNEENIGPSSNCLCTTASIHFHFHLTSFSSKTTLFFTWACKFIFIVVLSKCWECCTGSHDTLLLFNEYFKCLVNWPCSLSGKAENIDDDIVVFEGILLAEIAIVFAVPEATCAHVESAVALLQDDHVGRELEILVHLLEKLDDYFARVVAPLLRLLRVIVARLELPEDQVIDFLLYLRSHFLERYLLLVSAHLVFSGIRHCSIN